MKHNIENYENMSTEEKLAALEAYEPDMSGFVSKAQLDKVASEAASYKKQLREKMSAEEEKLQKEAERIADSGAGAMSGVQQETDGHERTGTDPVS